jgi:hypothetical protein
MTRAMWLTLLIVAATSGAALAQATGVIVNVPTGLVIGVRGSSTNDGAQLITWHSNGNASQSWSITPTGAGWFKLVNAGSGLCVGVAAGSTADGANIVQWHDDGSMNQQWRWERRGGGRSLLVNRGSGKVIGVAGGSTTQGTPLIQWHQDGTPNQLWHPATVGEPAVFALRRGYID